MKKETAITVLITVIVGVAIFISCLGTKITLRANTYYQVYLNGNKIGIIEDKNKLYNLIDSSQSAIKNEYNVNNVYPPTDLRIVAVNTYSDHYDNVNDIYNKIEENDNFTIKGYVVTIKGEKETFKINVLNKQIFFSLLINH